MLKPRDVYELTTWQWLPRRQDEVFAFFAEACLPLIEAAQPDIVHVNDWPLGVLLGREARRKSVHVVLAPTVNLHRTPIGGRIRLFKLVYYITGLLLPRRTVAAWRRRRRSPG